MNPVMKKLLHSLLAALIGSGITLTITENMAVKCTAVEIGVK